MLKQYTSVLRPFLALSSAAVLGLGSQANASTILAPEVSALHAGNIQHCDTVVAGRAFAETFECGDELFGTVFNAIDGVGINVGDGGHFTRCPADLAGSQWNRNVPLASRGPTANLARSATTSRSKTARGSSTATWYAILSTATRPIVVQRNTPQVLALRPAAAGRGDEPELLTTG
jgi:hypothetical protein